VRLYFFERVSENDFVGPVIVAAAGEPEAWTQLSRREGRDIDILKDVGWEITQELAAIPPRATIVYPGYYRRAVL
jgi:hypothetical protein